MKERDDRETQLVDRAEQANVKAQLDAELSELRFQGSERVFRSVGRVTFRQKLRAFWNAEVGLPVLPLAAIVVIAAGTWMFSRIRPEQPGAGTAEETVAARVIEAGGNHYRQDEYERMVASLENTD